MLRLGMAWLAGVCLAFLVLPPPPDPYLFAVILAIAALTAWVMRGRLIGVALLGAAVALFLGGLRLEQRMPDSAGRVDRILTGVIEDFPSVGDGTCRFRLRVGDTEDRGPRLERILVTWYECREPPRAGETWRFKLRVRAPRGLFNPGGFDFEQWAFRENLSATGYVRDELAPHRLAGCEAGPRLLCARAGLVERLRAWLDGNPGLPYVIALTTGTRHLLTDGDWEALRRTGTAHLFAISGLHVGVVAWFAWLVGSALGRIAQHLSGGIRARHVAAGISFLAALSYAALAGFAVSTLRSLAMITAVLVFTQLRRYGGLGAALGAALLVVLVPDPFAVLSPGFWLSFGAVSLLALSVLGLREPAAGSGGPGASSASSRVRRLAVAQWRISLGLAPLVLVFFGEVSVIGAAINLIAIPLFSLLIVPGLLAALLLSVAWPAGGVFLLDHGAGLLAALMSMLSQLSVLDMAAWSPPDFGFLPAILAVAGIVWLLAPRPAPARWAAPLLLVPAVLGMDRNHDQTELAVTVLDVGQGLAVLVQAPEYNLLYDAGPRYSSSDAGDSVVLPAIGSLGVRRLDALVVSHGDSDHAGGAASVLKAHPEAELIAPALYGLETDRYRRCVTGVQWAAGAVRFRALNPDTGSGSRGNDDSCVLVVEAPGVRVLLPGDLESRGESRLVGRALDGPFDLVLSPHHGSSSSSSSRFVQAVRPRLVAHSTGFFNRWGFPRDTVVARWTGAGARQWNTGASGALRFESRGGNSLELATEWRRDKARLWTYPAPAVNDSQLPGAG
ncbi:MAG: DNA internalization-related competence protein ComEC/Rec2 [Gammaproteobacteria bacterium]|nr:DNA internalization-related competence protein ComEC/Rec2 [Gammaproteobacteria bacterium]MYF66737.1 DNA internalization-related competence protein ComEC/Rec2 [Gammaproteobacteria bacterium]MYK36950.1 DNA internalization-related competence protein ComEC/Rec2 [Gammaproteobacteria bacterium]